MAVAKKRATTKPRSQNRPKAEPSPAAKSTRFQPGQSGNPGGRPKGIARQARELIGDDPTELLAVYLQIAKNRRAAPAHRLAAIEKFLDRAYGKAPMYAPVEGEDPLELDATDSRIAAVLDELAARREAPAAGEGAAGAVAADRASGAAAA